ncbi:Hypothetical predicted protein [Paramuricea clavata]|uniref:Uncharacterized protein n=1 Tax=Paramuricea clavata TaxID=317549 RepID=A0A6S7FRQ8_PARCT|nr:Hypothetical predicted protein [Paramuricea clavata]
MMTKCVYAILVLVKLLSVREGHAYETGAPPKACPTLTPGHGMQLTGNNPFTISVQRILPAVLHVTVSSSDNSDFQGFMLQAREVGSNTPLANFQSPPDHTQLIKCTQDADTATHSDITPKKSVTFMWVPTPGKTAKFRFHATVAINKANYWKGIVSDEIDLPLVIITQQPSTTSGSTGTPMSVALPSTDSQTVKTVATQPPPATIDTTQTVNGSVAQTTVTMTTTPSKAPASTSTLTLLVTNLILFTSVLLL